MGDQNRYFHACASQQKKKNWIKSVYDSADRLVYSPFQIDDVFIGYFQNIFTSSNPPCQTVEECVDYVEKMIIGEINAKLVKKFSKAEVQEAFNQINALKVPRPDGYNIGFYQSYLHIVGDEVSLLTLKFLNECMFEKSINYTYIIFIPNIKNPIRESDFRLISLCNVIYKIFSKVLANRPKKILPTIISNSQNAFILGRLITYNVIIAYKSTPFNESQIEK